MTVLIDSAALDLRRFLRKGDRIAIGQASSEPPNPVFGMR